MIVLVGYLASAILALSLMTGNALRFRWLNIAGCVSFIVYGVLINALPVMVANSFLLCINIYQLVKLYTYKENFHHIAFKTADPFVEKFLSFYKADIEKFFPGYHFTTDEGRICFVVLRDMVIANIFVARLNNSGRATVEINYTVEHYRDYKVGSFIFDKEKEYLLHLGVKEIVYEAVPNINHENFIRVMGFKKEQVDGTICYLKTLI